MSVTKELLIQYNDLLHEREEVKEKIFKLEKQIDKMEKDGKVVDKVMGGEGGLQSFKIEGFPYPEYQKKKALLSARKDILLELEMKILNDINEIEAFILTIHDSHIRRIVNLRIINKLSWGKVAETIGGDNTEDTVRMTFNRFLEKKQ